MVVLESHHGGNPHGGGAGGPNQYLQPDYLSPLPTTLDAKKSPLALLVQTCSQIGADSPSKFDNLSLTHGKRKSSLNIETKSLDTSDFSRPRSGSSSSPKSYINHIPHQSGGGKLSPGGRHSAKSDSSTTTTSTLSLINTNSSSSSSSSGKHSPEKSLKRPSSSNSTTSTNSCGSPIPSKMSRVSPPLNSDKSETAPTTGAEKREKHRRTPPEEIEIQNKEKSKTVPGSIPQDPQGANPIIRSGLEILSSGGRLQGVPSSHFMMNQALGLSGGYGSPYGHSDMLNPAFRHPFFPSGGPGGAHPFLSGYPGSSPYVSYTRVKTPSGGETIVPVCKDPYCTGCQFSAPNPSAPSYPSAAGGICPAGCAQCDHQKIPYPFAASMGYPPAFLSQHAAMFQQQQQQQANAHAAASAAAAQKNPHVCNWIVGESYCGERFANSEMLLQHLRSHTQNISASGGPEAAMAAAMAHQQHLAASSLYSSALLNPALAAAMQQRGFPNSPPISPYTSAAAKGVPMPPGFFPPSAYSFYGPRA